GAGHVGVSAATTTPAATPSASSRPTTTGAPAVAGGRRDSNGLLHDRGMDLAVIGKGPRRRERVLKRAGRLLSRVEGRTVVRRHRMGLAVGIPAPRHRAARGNRKVHGVEQIVLYQYVAGWRRGIVGCAARAAPAPR